VTTITRKGVNPRAARRRAGLTQSQAAMMIGAALRTWQDWESGARNMPGAKWALFSLLLAASPPQSQPPAAPVPQGPSAPASRH
jgi:DNA-binding transcriptional regulator YiaG